MLIHKDYLDLNTLNMIIQCFNVILHVFIICFSIPMYFMTYSASDSININNILILVNNLNLTSVFFKQAFHANHGTEKNEQDQVYIFQYICF